tara:strand:+ start:2530 stop:2793 length:264 start_codon:yes stop_codon:yes gene_type:complete
MRVEAVTGPTLETEIALMRQEIIAMRDESRTSRAEMKTEIGSIKIDVSAMKQQSAKWKGGIAVLVGIGGFFLVFLSVWEKLTTFIKG